MKCAEPARFSSARRGATAPSPLACAAHARNNEQLQQDGAQTKVLQRIVLGDLRRHAVFFSTALPEHAIAPLCNRYGGASDSFATTSTTRCA